MTTPGSIGRRGRYAPSPTGEMHLGNALSALLAWLSTRAAGGRFVMRMEDLDRARVKPGYAGQILEDLAWFGIDWDEGPDVGGPHPPYEQSARIEHYLAAFERLRGREQVYPCFCSRRDIASASSAPQTPGEERRYPGTCRSLDPVEATSRIDRGDRHAWRFRVDATECPRWEDLGRGSCGGAEPPGDFVILRSEGPELDPARVMPAYQLAVVVDDAAMQIDEVVRGDDLLPSTGKQILLQQALGFATPAFGHGPLLLGPDGVRLSKRHAGTSLRELREAGRSAAELVGLLAGRVGIRPDSRPVAAAALIGEFCWSRLAAAPEGLILADPKRF